MERSSSVSSVWARLLEMRRRAGPKIAFAFCVSVGGGFACIIPFVQLLGVLQVSGCALDWPQRGALGVYRAFAVVLFHVLSGVTAIGYAGHLVEGLFIYFWKGWGNDCVYEFIFFALILFRFL